MSSKFGKLCSCFWFSHEYRWWKGKIEEEEEQDLTLVDVEARVLRKNAPAPDTADLKDFLRWYGLSSKGRIRGPDGCVRDHASAESIKSEAERFFASFTDATGTPTLQEERTEIFWVSTLPLCLNFEAHKDIVGYTCASQ